MAAINQQLFLSLNRTLECSQNKKTEFKIQTIKKSLT